MILVRLAFRQEASFNVEIVGKSHMVINTKVIYEMANMFDARKSLFASMISNIKL
jgi:hypothetical protein